MTDLSATMENTLPQAVERAVDFLCERQLRGGEFQTFAAPDSDMKDCVPYGSPFLTTFVLYALRHCTHPHWPKARDKALRFLLAEQETGGWWRNHTRDNPAHSEHQLPLDLDDTAAVSQILSYYGLSFEDNRPAIRKQVNEDGLFLTWLHPPFRNEIDGVVNANVLFYLGDEELSAAGHLCEWVLSDRPFSQWYPDRLVFYYAVSRAFASGLGKLGEVRKPIVDAILRRQTASGSFGSDLQTVLALNTLANYGYRQSAWQAGIQYLLRRQGADGAWKIGPFYRGWKRFYGCEELTTALAVEALNHQDI